LLPSYRSQDKPLAVTAWEAGPASRAVAVSRFTMAVSITASLLAAVSSAVGLSLFVTVSGLDSLIHIFTLILIIGIQDPIAAIRSTPAKRRDEAYRA
jgi:hypothetical protein